MKQPKRSPTLATDKPHIPRYSVPKRLFSRLERSPKYEVQTEPRARPENVKERIVVERQFDNLCLEKEEVAEANGRCHQENLIAQLKGGVKALAMPVDNLMSNWAYMVMASLAWSLKAWAALLLPEGGRWKEPHRQQKQRLLGMEFATFLQAVIAMPAQILRTGRRIVYRLLSWKPWQGVFFRLLDQLRLPLRC